MVIMMLMDMYVYENLHGVIMRVLLGIMRVAAT